MITFTPLAEKDFTLLAYWLKQPHVATWWPVESMLSDEQIAAKYFAKIQSPHHAAFIIYLNNKPIGYIQYHDAVNSCLTGFPDQTKGTYGIDQFIGELYYLGKGYGTQMIKAFVAMLLEKPEVNRIIVDPNHKNARAIRCYEKVGFKHVGLVDTLDGVMALMELMRQP